VGATNLPVQKGPQVPLKHMAMDHTMQGAAPEELMKAIKQPQVERAVISWGRGRRTLIDVYYVPGALLGIFQTSP